MFDYYDYETEEISTENFWLICLNCEYEMSIDECFFDNVEEILSDDSIECPVCKSKEMRREVY